MTEQKINYETAKLANQMGFDLEYLHFYTKTRSKMFVLDEHFRYYPIKNTSKKLYTCGEEAALNIESVYPAPTQSLLQKWLREVHEIVISVDIETDQTYFISITSGHIDYGIIEGTYDTWEIALESGLIKALKLIKK